MSFKFSCNLGRRYAIYQVSVMRYTLCNNRIDLKKYCQGHKIYEKHFQYNNILSQRGCPRHTFPKPFEQRVSRHLIFRLRFLRVLRCVFLWHIAVINK